MELVSRHPFEWDHYDTVLLDMDGTLLDLRFDNFFWQELVPSRYAALHGLPHEEAVAVLEPRFAKRRAARWSGTASTTGAASWGWMSRR
jgi:5'-nucleotidase